MEASEIASMLRDRSDEEILSWVGSVGGPAAFLEQAFVGMREAFLGERAPADETIIQWDVTGPEELISYQLSVSPDACEAAFGSQQCPEVVLSMSLPTFLRLVTGGLDGRAAYEKGVLQVRGDRALAREISGWFKAPA